MCKEAQAAKDSRKKLSTLDFRFHFFPWSSHPLHNFTSHGADAFRMLTINLNRLAINGLSVEEWRNLRNQYVC
jgi:hypothetical protein